MKISQNFVAFSKYTNFTSGGGGSEEKEASSSQGPQNTQLLPNVKPVPLYSLVIDFFTHITYSLFLNILLFKFLIFHCRVVHSTKVGDSRMTEKTQQI